MGTIIQSRLRLTFQTGLDEFGDPTYRSKAYANVRPAASDEDVATAVKKHIILDLLFHFNPVKNLK